MVKVKISSLSKLDLLKYKNLALDRTDWLLDGSGNLIGKNTSLEKLTNGLAINEEEVYIKNVIKETAICKTIVLKTKDEKKLPYFRAGQYITLTKIIDGKFITRPYTITSSLDDALKGEYRITVERVENGIMSTYLVEEAEVGEKFTISGPFGNFYYTKLRDNSNVIGLASGRGITPFFAMVNALEAHDEDFKLNLLYNCRRDEDIIFKKELLRLADELDNFNLKIILSDEEREEYLNGFITAELIKDLGISEFSIFACGYEGFLKYLNKELEQFKLPRKFIRYEEYLPKCNIKKVKKYSMTVRVGTAIKKSECYNNKTILESLEDAKIYVPSRCHTGKCGLCKTKLINGKVKVVNDKRNKVDEDENFIHPCCTYPMSDIEIRIK